MTANEKAIWRIGIFASVLIVMAALAGWWIGWDSGVDYAVSEVRTAIERNVAEEMKPKKIFTTKDTEDTDFKN